MTNRVLLGAKGGTHGLYVSKPGVDVVTAGDNDLMVSTNRKAMQVVQNGVIGDPGISATIDIAIPSLGFTPLVLIWCIKYSVDYWFPSSTTLRLHTLGGGGIAGKDPSGQIRYVVTNIPQVI